MYKFLNSDNYTEEFKDFIFSLAQALNRYDLDVFDQVNGALYIGEVDRKVIALDVDGILDSTSILKRDTPLNIVVSWKITGDEDQYVLAASAFRVLYREDR